MPLADRRARRHRDDGVGERPPRRLAQAQPLELDRRLDAGDRGAGRRLLVGGCLVHEHVDVAPDQPRRRHEHERGDEERGDRVAAGIAGRGGDQPREHGERAGEVAAEVECVRAERLAAVAPRRPERDDGAAEIDREHDADDAKTHQVGSTSLSILPSAG